MKARDFLFSGSMSGLAVFFLIVLPLAAGAGMQKAVVVDGQYDEWDLHEDSSRPMHTDHNTVCTCNVHGGRKCIGEVVPNVYLRYDSITNTVFVLVLEQDGMKGNEEKPVVNIDTLGRNSPAEIKDAGEISDFSWVMDGGQRVGWEGAFQLAPGTYDCDRNAKTGKRVETVPQRTRASEVQVIDTENLFSTYK